jgi:small subunit ribosomal protein S1
VVKVGEMIEVKILRVDTEERKIGLSRKRVKWAEEDHENEEAAEAAAAAGGGGKPTTELKGGVGGGGGPLIKPAGA